MTSATHNEADGHADVVNLIRHFDERISQFIYDGTSGSLWQLEMLVREAIRWRELLTSLRAESAKDEIAARYKRGEPVTQSDLEWALGIDG